MCEIKYIYESYEGKDIITRVFIGEITIPVIIDSFQFLITSNKITNQCVGIITDTTNAKMNVKISELRNIYNYLRTSSRLRNLKLAVIVSTPEATILPMLAMKTFTSVKVQPFSGYKAAISWILT